MAKDNETKYNLEITQEQAKIISYACDLYCRVSLGQFDRIVEFCMEKEFFDGTCTIDEKTFPEWLERKKKAYDLMLQVRQNLFPELYGNGKSYGIGKDTNANTAYNVHQVLRYYTGNDERIPYALYGELPKIKIME